MPATPTAPPRFARSLWLTLGIFLVFALVFAVYVRAEKAIDRANEVRLNSYQLADELRQSSDDLTRLVRSYVFTGNPLFKRQYLQILAIRDGKLPRPPDYQNIYWDLMRTDTLPADGERIALLELMRRAGFTQTEFAKLAQAKANSDTLTRIEFAAMQLIETPDAQIEQRRLQALTLLHDSAYHDAKAGIMLPISEFQRMMEVRVSAAVNHAIEVAFLMRIAFMLFGAALVYLLWRNYVILRATLGGSADELQERIARLGSGDFASPIDVPQGMKNSVLGWLSATQSNLARIDAERLHAEQHNLRLTRLYGALSQCNQAIVRCHSEAELFPQICRDAVNFGGMKMAWIGLLDTSENTVRPVAAFGSGTEYLAQLQIKLDSDDATHCGPTATAIRENHPFWCQDFANDPTTAPWHEQGRIYGWAASAALPLHRDGIVIGAFSLYADETNAFDEAVTNLLLEMAMDIDHALNSFQREARREQAERALRASEQRLRTVIETEPECIKLLDSDGRLLEMNPAGLAMLEADSLEQAQQSNLLSFVLPDYRAPFIDLLRQVLQGESGILEFEIKGLKGTRRWLETHATPMQDSNGESRLLGVTRDITARKQAEERVQYMAHYDALTGLPNRVLLEDHASYAIQLAQRNNDSLAVLFLDLDHFKDINDTLGHSVGDALLVELANRLRQTLRAEDTVSRLGGDEFILLLPGAQMRGVAQVAQKLLDVIAEPCRIAPYDLSVNASIGIALYPDDGLDLETLSKCADTAMYRAKQEGRHDFRFFTPEMQARSARNLQLVNALRSALERSQFEVHYQPQVSLQDGRIIGAEALLRWRHPEMGTISPAEFIPVAEDSGLILPIGEWVLRQAVQQTQTWLRDGLGPLVVAVNLSVVQFRLRDLPTLVTQILEQHGLPPEYLELELTEGVAMQDAQGAISVMSNLHDRGVRMSIDDFGTGYSSLSHLKKFKVYKLKIDQSFVRDISTDPEDKAIVSAIIQMARSLGLKTIAEGVETTGQQDFLREQGCDEAQGYFYSRPLPADQFTELLAQKTASAG